MSDTYQQVLKRLRASYNGEMARERDEAEIEAWKAEEREAFLRMLQEEGKTRLLEVGAGTGRDSLYFQEQGLQVVCTDLSPAMVALCRQKGLEAYEMDFLSLDFAPASFDAIFALNCLLHVPSADLPLVLQKLQNLLRPGGLFFLGTYGGFEYEDVRTEDNHQPPRFFTYHSDEYLLRAVEPFFQVVSFKKIALGKPKHFQELILRRIEIPVLL